MLFELVDRLGKTIDEIGRDPDPTRTRGLLRDLLQRVVQGSGERFNERSRPEASSMISLSVDLLLNEVAKSGGDQKVLLLSQGQEINGPVLSWGPGRNVRRSKPFCERVTREMWLNARPGAAPRRDGWPTESFRISRISRRSSGIE